MRIARSALNYYTALNCYTALDRGARPRLRARARRMQFRTTNRIKRFEIRSLRLISTGRRKKLPAHLSAGSIALRSLFQSCACDRSIRRLFRGTDIASANLFD